MKDTGKSQQCNKRIKSFYRYILLKNTRVCKKTHCRECTKYFMENYKFWSSWPLWQFSSVNSERATLQPQVQFLIPKAILNLEPNLKFDAPTSGDVAAAIFNDFPKLWSCSPPQKSVKIYNFPWNISHIYDSVFFLYTRVWLVQRVCSYFFYFP